MVIDKIRQFVQLITPFLMCFLFICKPVVTDTKTQEGSLKSYCSGQSIETPTFEQLRKKRGFDTITITLKDFSVDTPVVFLKKPYKFIVDKYRLLEKVMRQDNKYRNQERKLLRRVDTFDTIYINLESTGDCLRNYLPEFVETKQCLIYKNEIQLTEVHLADYYVDDKMAQTTTSGIIILEVTGEVIMDVVEEIGHYTPTFEQIEENMKVLKRELDSLEKVDSLRKNN